MYTNVLTAHLSPSAAIQDALCLNSEVIAGL